MRYTDSATPLERATVTVTCDCDSVTVTSCWDSGNLAVTLNHANLQQRNNLDIHDSQS